jgi:hypothetical protein
MLPAIGVHDNTLINPVTLIPFRLYCRTYWRTAPCAVSATRNPAAVYMTETPGNLTVRVVMTPTPITEPSFLGRYRWDRILLVAGLLGLLALDFYWLLG